MRAGSGERAGFALVAVLWALVVISGVALLVHGEARADRRATMNAYSEARARWAARAGFAHTLQTLERRLAGFTPLGTVPFRADTLLPPAELIVDGIRTRAAVLDHRARLNINTAGWTELLDLLVAESVPIDQARQLAWRILEHRDMGEGRGAIAGGDYPWAPRPTSHPGSGAFLAVEELRMVPGVTAEIYRILEPHVTVAGDGRVNVNSASLPVLLTIPGFDVPMARHVVQRRARAPYANAFELIQEMPAGPRQESQDRAEEFLGRIAFGPRTVAIVVEAWSPESPSGAGLNATIELLGGPAFDVTAVSEGIIAASRVRAPGSPPGRPGR